MGSLNSASCLSPSQENSGPADGRRLQSSNMGRRAAEFAENAKRKAVSVPATKRRKREDVSDEGSDDEEAMVPEALTRKIISQARQQQEEMESEDAPKQPRRGVSFAPAAALATAAGAGAGGDDDDDDDEDAGEEEEVTAEYYEVEDVELDEGDERALDLFMGSRAPQTLADIIMQKIAQHQESAEAWTLSKTSPAGPTASSRPATLVGPTEGELTGPWARPSPA